MSLRKNLIEKQQEVETLKKERCTLMDNNKSFKINLVINKEGIQEYQVVNQKQVNSIKKLKEEVERLKNYISDVHIYINMIGSGPLHQGNRIL